MAIFYNIYSFLLIEDQFFLILSPLSPFYPGAVSFTFSTFVPVIFQVVSYFPDGCCVQLIAEYLDLYFYVE